MKPVEALQRAIEAGFLSSRAFKPGEVVGHLPREIRDAIQDLTSDDALRLRPDFLFPLSSSTPAPHQEKGK